MRGFRLRQRQVRKAREVWAIYGKGGHPMGVAVTTENTAAGWAWRWFTTEGLDVSVEHKLEWAIGQGVWVGATAVDSGAFNSSIEVNDAQLPKPNPETFEKANELAKGYITRQTGQEPTY